MGGGMKDLPILFKGEMVRAIMDDRKTNTRRLRGLEDINVNPGLWKLVGEQQDGSFAMRHGDVGTAVVPRYHRGDTAWVQETHCFLDRHIDGTEREDPCIVGYRADESIIRFEPEPKLLIRDKTSDYGNFKWRPSIFMHRWASRITLEVTDVRVQRLQDITEEDAIAEGVDAPRCEKCGYTLWDCKYHMDHRLCGEAEPKSAVPVFHSLWDRINAKRGFGWAANPWVFAYTFRRAK